MNNKNQRRIFKMKNHSISCRVWWWWWWWCCCLVVNCEERIVYKIIVKWTKNLHIAAVLFVYKTKKNISIIFSVETCGLHERNGYKVINKFILLQLNGQIYMKDNLHVISWSDIIFFCVSSRISISHFFSFSELNIHDLVIVWLAFKLIFRSLHRWI